MLIVNVCDCVKLVFLCLLFCVKSFLYAGVTEVIININQLVPGCIVVHYSLY